MIDIQAECQRLGKERDQLAEQIARISEKLGNEAFTGKAPAQVVQRERDRLAEYQAALAQITERMNGLCG
jgi:valyl-tRNA synthetase